MAIHILRKGEVMGGRKIKFDDIPKFPHAAYKVHVPWNYIEKHLENLAEGKGGLELDPDFQRAHVWTEEQQCAYIEYQLMGGEVSKTIIFNCPGWMSSSEESTVQLVDGKQRLEAVRKFMRGDLKAFGQTVDEFGRFPSMHYLLEFAVCALETREEVLQLYLNINAGGTPHTQAELDRVRKLLKGT